MTYSASSTSASTCRERRVELFRNGTGERLPIDPDGAFGLTGEEADVLERIRASAS